MSAWSGNPRFPARWTPRSCGPTSTRSCPALPRNAPSSRRASATADLGVGETVKVSNSPADWAPNIQALVGQPCDLILTVGPLMRDVTRTEAKANPGQDFAIVGAAIDPPLDNVLGLTFRIDQAAF